MSENYSHSKMVFAANSGCRGGDQGVAYRYIKRVGGVNTEKVYPYQARVSMHYSCALSYHNSMSG